MIHVAKRYSGRCPTHPGVREDVIPATGRTKAEIAQLLGISHQHLYGILRERKPVSPAVAVRRAWLPIVSYRSLWGFCRGWLLQHLSVWMHCLALLGEPQRP